MNTCKHELNDSTIVPLIDKVTIKGFKLINVNKELAKSPYFLESIDVKTGERITTVKIKDSYIDILKYTECGSKIKSSIELSINDPIYKNLFCMTVDDLQKKLVNVKKYIALNYGLDFDLSEIVVSRMEINKTFSLNDEYNLYHDPISAILNHMFDSTKNEYFMDGYEIANDRIHYNSYYAKGSGYDIKIYNKSKEMESKNIKIEPNIMRFEITCKDKKMIERFLDTSRVFNMRQEVLAERFHKWIVKTIKNPVEHFLEQNIQKLSEMLQERNQNDSSQTYIRSFLNEIHILENDSCKSLISLPMLNEVVDGCMFKSNSQCPNNEVQAKIRYQRKKRFRQLAQTEYPEWKNDKYGKVEEILANLK